MIETIIFALIAVVAVAAAFYLHFKSSSRMATLHAELGQLKEQAAALQATNQMLNEGKATVLRESTARTQELEAKQEQLRREKEQLARELTALREQEPIRQTEHSKKIDGLNLAFENLEKERAKDMALKEQEDAARLKALRETWSRHEPEIEQKMKLICQQLSVEYVDKERFPFSGKPDNAVKICGEYVIFDSKSPQGEDIANFPSYIRNQAEAAKKYTKNEEVKKDIYLVVPLSAIAAIPSTFIDLGAFRVHVITGESLLPILLHLQKIESYEFAEKLSPEDREKIVTVIGKMAHGMKRRVQIDYFMANEFISILTDAENLPTEILEGAQTVERASKLNPTVEKRSKRIETSALLKEGEKLAGKVAGQEIHTGPELRAIESIPLYK